MPGINKFVIVYTDDTIRAVPENIVSRMYDLADCDYMDGVRDIYAIDERGALVPVEVGPQTRYGNWDSEGSVYYASAPIKAGKKVAGFVHYSDH